MGKRTKITDKLMSKYRLIIMKENTFEEKVSVRVTRFAIIFILSFVFLITSLIVFFLIAHTPLKEYIKGYGKIQPDSENAKLVSRLDSLENSLIAKEIYIKNIKYILSGNIEAIDNDSVVDDSMQKHKITIEDVEDIEEDSILRSEIEGQSIYSAQYGEAFSSSNLSSYLFFAPIKGTPTDEFNIDEKHFGIDIAAKIGSGVKATLEGIVILAGWELNTGNIIAIQHDDDLISIYKHNSTIFKKQGDFVFAGEVISLSGNSGEFSSGPHLHFELWHKGIPLNPRDYMNFE